MNHILMFLFLLIIVKSSLAEDAIIETTYGKIQGHTLQTRQEPHVEFYAFEGIPYAKPALGNLRFQAPVKPEVWGNDTLICQNSGQICSQYDQNNDRTNGGEDCLFLNVYTKNLNQSSKAPVMVWVHGGSYIAGTGSSSAPDYLMEKSIVFVTINYRLDIFGFLTVMDENAYGNAGLKDQLFALEWVSGNIDKFGGDPDKVTLFGESAGSNAVSLLQLSQRSNGLFHQIISESSSALSNRHFQRNPLMYVYNIAEYFNVNTKSTRDIVQGLQKIDYQDLIRAANDANITGYATDFGPFPFYPVVEVVSEEAVLTRPPYQILKDGDFNRIPFIFGHNTNEGTYGLSLFESSGMSVEDFDTKYELFSSKSFQNEGSAQYIGKLVRDYFIGNDSVANTEKFAKYLAQELYVRANRKELDFLRQYSKGFYYRFSYKGTHTTQLSGTGHGEELQYLFYSEGNAENLTESDILTRKRMVEMWTNFATFGSPTPQSDPLLQNIQWLVADNETTNFLDIGKDLVVGINPDDEDYDFWEYMFWVFGVEPLQTY